MKNEHILIILLIACIAIGAYAGGYITINQHPASISQPSTTGVPYQQPTQSQTPSTGTEPSAQLYFEVTDGIAYTDVASTTDVDIVKSSQGVFNFLQAFDEKAQSTNPQAMNSMYADGSEIIIHIGSTVTPTAGAGYYDGWYYCILHVGNPIYQMDYGDFSVSGTSPSYTYTISQSAVANDPIVAYVSWTSGTTPYWNLGKLYIFPRISTDSTESVSYQSVTLAKVNDGSTWVNVNTRITANATLASTNEQITFSMYAKYANLGYGFPLFVVGSNGAILNYKTYLVFTTNMLAIAPPSGWNSLSDTTLYAEKGFYEPVGPFFAAKGGKESLSITIPIDSSNAAHATQYLFKFWIIDCQNPASLPQGTMVTTIPTAYGFITQYGISAAEQTYAYTTSSGSSATPQLETYLTTPT